MTAWFFIIYSAAYHDWQRFGPYTSRDDCVWVRQIIRDANTQDRITECTEVKQ